MNLTKIEQEVIFLKASNEMIDAIVNHEMLTVSVRTEGGEARFKSSTHQRLFNIILVDFLSKSASEITGESKSYLEALLYICQNPSFNKSGSISYLSIATQTYPDGLNTKFAKNCYWELMNEVRSQPYINRFRTYDCLKIRY